MVPKKIQVPKETVTTEEVRKHKNEKKVYKLYLYKGNKKQTSKVYFYSQ